MKKTVTLWIEEDLIRAARYRNINLSKMLTTVLSALVASDVEVPDVVVDIKAKMHAYMKQKDALLRLRKRYEDMVKSIDRELEGIDKRINLLEVELQHHEESFKVAALIREYNEVIRSCDYDIDFSWEETKEIRKKLATMNFTVDREWHEAQVKRMKQRDWR